jgi:hypothetical protein
MYLWSAGCVLPGKAWAPEQVWGDPVRGNEFWCGEMNDGLAWLVYSHNRLIYLTSSLKSHLSDHSFLLRAYAHILVPWPLLFVLGRSRFLPAVIYKPTLSSICGYITWAKDSLASHFGNIPLPYTLAKFLHNEKVICSNLQGVIKRLVFVISWLQMSGDSKIVFRFPTGTRNFSTVHKV